MDKQGRDTFLPERIRAYLNGRGISDKVLFENKITWDGTRIVIPVFNADGVWIHNKYRRDPAASEGPKYTYDKGATAALYGIDKALNAKQVIVAEGELDTLVLETQGFVGVCSTGGAGTFKQEWIELLVGKELFMCFDNDMAGRTGMARLAKMRPDIKMIPLPAEVGEHGDVTDFFVKLQKTRRDYEVFMKIAQPLTLPPEPKPRGRQRNNPGILKDRLGNAKEVPLDKLLQFNRAGFAVCPFHAEKTPSLHWIKKSNRAFCFGCSWKGDAIDLAMGLRDVKMSAAIDYLLSL